jgi:hypothetical protein
LFSAAIVLVAALFFIGPATAEKPKAAKPAAKQSAKEPACADYRNWKTINTEPIAVPARQFGLCEPAGAAEPNGPHAGGFVNIYVNSIGRDEYLSEQPPAFAEGTVIVKEKLKEKDEKDPHELGIMIKRETGYAPDSGDWQYVFVDRKGNVTDKQSTLNCAKCHQIQADNDYVYRRLPSANANQNDNDNSNRSNSRKK